MIRIEYVVRCDECGAIYDWRQFDSKKDALHQVTTDGWAGNMAHLLCPACVRNVT
jgi:hypothetical protein